MQRDKICFGQSLKIRFFHRISPYQSSSSPHLTGSLHFGCGSILSLFKTMVSGSRLLAKPAGCKSAKVR